MTSPELKVLDEIEQKAREAELLYHGCARSTLYGLKQHFDFIPEELITAASSLAGGCRHSNGSCGAYCGGLLAIGLKFDAPIEDLSEEGLAKKEAAKRKEIAFRDSFLKEFGTTMCPDMLERQFGRRFSFMDEKQHEEFLSLPDHFEKCSSVVAKSARMAAEIILERR